jgi:hypothetical protein
MAWNPETIVWRARQAHRDGNLTGAGDRRWSGYLFNLLLNPAEARNGHQRLIGAAGNGSNPAGGSSPSARIPAAAARRQRLPYTSRQSMSSKWTMLWSARVSVARYAMGSSHPAHYDCDQRRPYGMCHSFNVS